MSSRSDEAVVTSHAASNGTTTAPVVTKDPRFVAGRTMVQSGPEAQQGAIEMFATLLEETTAKYGDTSLEAAACFYEYGNALFRAAVAKAATEAVNIDDDLDDEGNETKKRKAAAAAAESRAGKMAPQPNPKKRITDEDRDKDLKPAAKVDGIKPELHEHNYVGNDISLALEMMETSWSILDNITSEGEEINQSDDDVDVGDDWIKNQLPRILIGLGDVLTELKRHADAVDTYLRALPYREEKVSTVVETKDAVEKKRRSSTIWFLKSRRQLAELYALIAETLLACPAGVDVVTTETKEILVPAAEREEYVQGYYDRSRDETQETVLLLGQLSASSSLQVLEKDEITREKENICFLATMLMGVGEQLAEIDERKKMASVSKTETKPTGKKRRKRS